MVTSRAADTVDAGVEQEIQDYLKGVCSDLNIVKGEFDEANFPETKVLQIGAFKIGLCHGHQVRSRFAASSGVFPRAGAQSGAQPPASAYSLLCNRSSPQVVPWGDLESLAMLQRQMDVDILVTGHTHQVRRHSHPPRPSSAAAVAACSRCVRCERDTVQGLQI
jgi:vacuolar protein sorting-associated protein 29